MESMGTPRQYGAAVGVGPHKPRQNCSTKLAAKPVWLKWTSNFKGVKRQEKWIPRNHSTNPIKSIFTRSKRRRLKSVSTSGSSKKIDKVINIEPNWQRVRGLCCRRVVWIPNKTSVEARIMGVGDKTDGGQNRINLFIPVLRTTSKAIESLLKQPIFIFCSAGITGRQANNF